MTEQGTRRPRNLCIPGLVHDAFTKGSSKHSAACPVLKQSHVDDETGHCSFAWEAQGSSGQVYKIEAVGKLEMELETHEHVQGGALGRGLKVTCSCRDGQHQAVASAARNRIIVCKHGAAALDSVLDAEAEAPHRNNMENMRRERAEAAAQRLQEEQEEQRAAQQQEQELPGERARISYGLKALSDKELQNHLENASKTVAGLKALATLFPESIMPTPQTKYCVRCKKDYDDRFQKQTVCRLEHPEELCNEKWDGSNKISWKHCLRCDGDFDIPVSYCGRNRNRNAPSDAGKWCFEGDHTQDEDLVREENWDADPGDLY